MLNTLLLYPDRPYGIGTLYGTEFDQELKRRIRFVIAEPRDLPEDRFYAKERKAIRKELAERRRCQVFAGGFQTKMQVWRKSSTSRMLCALFPSRVGTPQAAH